ncbi:TatD family hydrolase [Clostridium felsineum]|uniref:TatD family hydrolase n=1 Tax=Clostridium felsineum TaxID=36839 RepID=UPI00098C86DC|nr:TatD family hydrolase [Clostridium felsineum]URZ01035.1 putative metal-dependent hydrolase YcfH [Clostridium felsineum]
MFVDAHNHLDFFESKEKLDKALGIIRNEEILTLGCSMDCKSYEFTKKLAVKNKNIIPCFGIHPSKAHENYKKLDKFHEYIKESRIIGEIGLDYVWVKEKEKYPYMKKVFIYFLEQARRYNKITNIHTKGAEGEIYPYIKKYKLKTPIIHWYSGDKDTLRKLLEYGCYFTISVDIEYSKLSKEIVQFLPLDKILTETDGPTSLQWVNGRYGYPSVIKDIVKEIAKIKKVKEGEVEKSILNNFKSLI